MLSVPPFIVHPAPPTGLGVEQRIAWLASRQHGLVTRSQLAALGLTRHQIAGRSRRGLLTRTHRAVYALGTRPSTPEAVALAGVLACGAGAVASHGTAAALQGMLPARRPVHVTTPPPAGRRIPGLALHTSTSSTATATTVSGVPCTSPPRTLVDVADRDGLLAATRAWATLAGRRALRPRAIEYELRTHPHRPGTSLVRSLLEDHRATVTGRTRSQLESAALHLFAAQGLPAPRLNHLLCLDDGTYEADMVWADARLVVELDGWSTHGDADSFRRDRRRDFDLELAGWSTVRLVWDDIARHPSATVDRLRRRLARGR